MTAVRPRHAGCGPWVLFHSEFIAQVIIIWFSYHRVGCRTAARGKAAWTFEATQAAQSQTIEHSCSSRSHKHRFLSVYTSPRHHRDSGLRFHIYFGAHSIFTMFPSSWMRRRQLQPGWSTATEARHLRVCDVYHWGSPNSFI